MSKLNMQAHLCRLPVNIEEIFFGEQQIKVHPSNSEQLNIRKMFLGLKLFSRIYVYMSV